MDTKDELIADLESFMKEYESRTNARDMARWRETIAEDATYWFTDGSYEGIDNIVDAVQGTFAAIQDEVYTISNAQWVVATPEAAVVRYQFRWVGYIDGQKREGQGRGTNTLVKREGRWLMLHEHLSV
ncbi:YybH family protein [Arthrobacter monumenti]